MTRASPLSFSQETAAHACAAHLETARLVVVDRHEETQVEYPPLPYTTALLLEDATARLGWTVAQVTETAQRLFETGLITYPRTDSSHLAPEAIQAGRQVVVHLFGPEAVGEEIISPQPAAWSRPPHLPPPTDHKNAWWTRFWQRTPQPRLLAAPSPLAAATEATEPSPLEAHEAIRPTDPAKRPDLLRADGMRRDGASNEDGALYHLIWARFLASLMKPARYRVITVELEARA